MKLHDAIVATFNSPEMKAIKKSIQLNENDSEWDWHHGGCYGVANALCQALGKKATKMAMVVFDKGFDELPWAAEHGIVKVGNDFYDGRGLRTLAQLKKEYFTKKFKHDIKRFDAEGVWYADDYYLYKHYGLIKKILLTYLDK